MKWDEIPQIDYRDMNETKAHLDPFFPSYVTDSFRFNVLWCVGDKGGSTGDVLNL
jgi:hypothetical protein